MHQIHQRSPHTHWCEWQTILKYSDRVSRTTYQRRRNTNTETMAWNRQCSQWSMIPKWMILMCQLFYCIKTIQCRSDFIMNDLHSMTWFFLVNQTHAVWPMESNLQTNDSNQSVLCGESNTAQCSLICWRILFSESSTYIQHKCSQIIEMFFLANT